MVLVGHKGTDGLGKGLLAQVGDVGGTKGVGLSGYNVRRAYLATYHHVVRLHKAVFSGKTWQYIVVKLKAQKYNEHAQEVGEEETGRLGDANMMSQ